MQRQRELSHDDALFRRSRSPCRAPGRPPQRRAHVPLLASGGRQISSGACQSWTSLRDARLARAATGAWRGGQRRALREGRLRRRGQSLFLAGGILVGRRRGARSETDASGRRERRGGHRLRGSLADLLLRIQAVQEGAGRQQQQRLPAQSAEPATALPARLDVPRCHPFEHQRARLVAAASWAGDQYPGRPSAALGVRPPSRCCSA